MESQDEWFPWDCLWQGAEELTKSNWRGNAKKDFVMEIALLRSVALAVVCISGDRLTLVVRARL